MSATTPPGLRPEYVLALARESVARSQLELEGLTVLTEAATGAYAVSATLAALAGAQRVLAVAGSSAHGSAEEACRQTLDLAELAGLRSRLEVYSRRQPELFARADLVTNSGHLRPLDAAVLRVLPASTVITLMYEAWELRPQDLDLQTCRELGIPVAGVNERHPAVRVFDDLGDMLLRLAQDAALAVRGRRVLLLCDNPFRQPLAEALSKVGASVRAAGGVDEVDQGRPAEVVVLANGPGVSGAEQLLEAWPGANCLRFWGDLPQSLASSVVARVWPRQVRPGHMGILPSALGPDPIVRLQTGGLKVGEVLARARQGGLEASAVEAAAVASGWANLPS